MTSSLWRALIRSQLVPSSRRNFSAATTQIGVPADNLVGNHTAKWMQDRSKKSPMELINEVPPIKIDGRIAACEGDTNPAIGHPIEFICLDLDEPAICKYCGLCYVQDHHSSSSLRLQILNVKSLVSLDLPFLLQLFQRL
ncbi:unnamed protein product [Cochlearia groenlandica]